MSKETPESEQSYSEMSKDEIHYNPEEDDIYDAVRHYRKSHPVSENLYYYWPQEWIDKIIAHCRENKISPPELLKIASKPEQERLFTLDEMLDCWFEATKWEGHSSEYKSKQVYFKEKFNIDLKYKKMSKETPQSKQSQKEMTAYRSGWNDKSKEIDTDKSEAIRHCNTLAVLLTEAYGRLGILKQSNDWIDNDGKKRCKCCGREF